MSGGNVREERDEVGLISSVDSENPVVPWGDVSRNMSGDRKFKEHTRLCVTTFGVVQRIELRRSAASGTKACYR